MSSHTRREFLGESLTAAAVLALTPSAARGARPRQAEQRPWLAAALKTETWLGSVAQRDNRGIAWPVDPTNPAVVQTDLYSGMAGVVLFYLELHHATGDAGALAEARGGADYLLSSLPDEPTKAAMGLYTGLAGVAVVLSHAHRATRDERYRVGVRRILDLLAASARSADGAWEWNSSTDIISGSAGIGLALLALASDEPERVDFALASAAGRRLIERAQAVDGGLTWRIQPDMPRNYPNFSHGTAGVSFFLARLSAALRRPSFRESDAGRECLDAALAGERWLRSRMTTTMNDGRMIYHSAPGNENLYYLSWCHGPAGTARLYRALAVATGDAAYDEWVPRLATAIVDMKVPERSAGFWNNVSQCCGNCGVTEFFLALHRRTGNAGYLTFAERVAHDTLARATPERDGLMWIQAEHRVRPELLVAQTGLMQGAAGVGLAMLHLDGARQRRTPFVRLPDEAF